MKKQFALIMMCAIVALSAQGQAVPKKDLEKAQILQGKDKVFKLLYSSSVPSDVRITIRNDKDQIVQQETIFDKVGFMRPYNLGEMQEGIYSMEIDDGSEKIVREIDTRSPQMISVSEKNRGVYRVFLDDEIAVPYALNIYDDRSNLVYHEKHPDGAGFTRIYNLTALNSSSFTFQLSADKITQNQRMQ